MLKKILVGMGLVGTLATQGFSDEFQINKNFCNNYKNFKYNFFEKIKNSANLIAMADVANSMSERSFGKLSTSMLYESGIGIELAKDYKTIAYTFNEYLLTLSDEDTKELSKFYLVIFLDHNKLMTDASEEIQKKYFIEQINKRTKLIFQNGNNGFDGKVHVNFFNSNFEPESKRIINLDLYNHFTKLVLLHDYVKAKEYIKSTNKKYDIDKFFVQYDDECKKIK